MLVFTPDTFIRVTFGSQECFCYTSLTLTEHFFQNLHIFYSFEKLTIIEEENYSTLQSVWSKLPVIGKFSAVNNDMKILRF